MQIVYKMAFQTGVGVEIKRNSRCRNYCRGVSIARRMAGNARAAMACYQIARARISYGVASCTLLSRYIPLSGGITGMALETVVVFGFYVQIICYMTGETDSGMGTARHTCGYRRGGRRPARYAGGSSRTA